MASHASGHAGSAPIRIPLNVAASKTSGQIGSLLNPEFGSGGVTPPQGIIKRATLLIKTPSTAACTLDIGTGSTATTDATNLFSGKSVAGAPANTVYTNVLSGTGVYMNAGDYVTVTVASGNANGLTGEVLVDYDNLPSID